MPVIFVYGTLKAGKVRHVHMKGATFLRAAASEAKYALFQAAHADYPCMVEDPTHGVAVEGELWEVSDECLQHLDVVEGVPAWFQRRLIFLDDGSEVHAYLMAKKPDDARRLGCRWD